MKNSQNLLNEIHSCFPCDERDIRSYSSLNLAFLGDAVFEVIVRTLIVEQSKGPVKKLHKRASELVNAASQADLVTALQEDMTEEELTAFRHGRNAKTSSVAKNADIHDYRNATGLESLFGYLYLTGRSGRAVELLKLGFEHLHITV